MKLRPLGDKVIVTVDEARDRSKGGIILPDSAKERPHQGKVLSVGRGRTLENGKVVPVDVRVGDTVLFTKYGGNEVERGADEYMIVSESDILAVLG